MSSAQPIVVAITGAQGVGKSTLGRELAAACRERLAIQVELRTGSATEVGRRGLPLGRKAGAETLRAFAEIHLDWQTRARGPLTILDRCLLDSLAYARLLGGLEANARERLEKRAAGALRQLDAIFYLGITSDYGVRSPLDEDLATRRRVDRAILELAADLRLGLHRLDPERTAEQAYAVVARCFDGRSPLS